MRRLLRDEAGLALLAALAFLVLAVPLVTAGTSLAGVLSTDSRVKTGILKSQYAAIGGSEYALHRLAYQGGYLEGLTAGVPDTFSITLNGQEVQVTVTKVSDPPSGTVPPNADSSRRLQTLKSVQPQTGEPLATTTFAYTITVENRDDEPENVKKVYDALPAGFAYVPGSTSGVTGADPSVETTTVEGRTYQRLTWNLAPLSITLQPGVSTALGFQAEASAETGSYCNEAWVDPGGTKTSTGLAARVTIGSPATDLCPGQALSLEKAVEPAVAPSGFPVTHTYTVTLENLGTEALSISRVRDLLPAGFAYVAGSTSGDLTSGDPAATLFQGRQRLTWEFEPPSAIGPAQVIVLSFRATADVPAGDYWNEAWVTVAEFSYPIYTWPTAVAQRMGVAQTDSRSADTTVSSEVWLGTNSYIVALWEAAR